MNEPAHSNASFSRRMGSIIYDGFLIVALLIVSSLIIIPFTGEIPASNVFYPFFLYLEVAAFYIYFWCATGQTLGMQTWRIKVVDDRGNRIDPATGVLRFAVATISLLGLGLGFLWAFTNKERLMLHDIASDTRVIHEKPAPKETEAPKKKKKRSRKSKKS